MSRAPGSSRPRTRGLVLPAAVAAALLASSLPGQAPTAIDVSRHPVQGPASLVDPFVGTSGFGDTSPAAAAPFGMLQWGPSSLGRPPGDYSAGVPTVGLSLTHLSGVGCAAFGDVPILPIARPLPPRPVDATATLGDQVAAPGRWSGAVGAVHAAVAVTTRAGLATFVFPAGRPATLLVKTGDSATHDRAATTRLSGSDLTGFVRSGGICERTSFYSLYFAARLSVAPSSEGTWTATARPSASRIATGAGSGAWVSFGTPSHALTVTMRVGISDTSAAEARANLGAGLTSWSRAALERRTTASWNALLGRITVRGPLLQRRIFYTALYHALLGPEITSNADGTYRGFDGRIHEVAHGRSHFSDISGWDVQNAEAPLLDVLAPHQASGVAQSLVADAEQGGWLPRWPVSASYGGLMEGDPADVILADAYAFGARGFNTGAALRAMVKGATVPQSYTASDEGQGDYVERYGLSAFNSLGWVPGNASMSLQYALDDAAVAHLATALGQVKTARRLRALAANWKLSFDPANHSVEPRLASGAFVSTTITAHTVTDAQAGFDEGNASQYSWLVPEDLPGLVGELGGNAAMLRRLDAFFSTDRALASEPGYTAASEQDLEAPWEFDATSQPARAGAVTRKILERSYHLTPGGLPGNDDLGTLSAWAVWAMLGLYPLVPGTATAAVGIPAFARARLRLSDGASLVVTTTGASPRTGTVRSVLVDGRLASRRFLSWRALDRRHRTTSLRFELASAPTGGSR